MVAVQDTLYQFFISFADRVELILIIGTIITVILSLNKNRYIGAIIPILALITAIYWWTSPLPSWRLDTPYMSGMRIIIWIPLTLWFFVVFAICRIIVHRRLLKHHSNEEDIQLK